MQIRERKYPSGKTGYQFDAGYVVIEGKRRRYQKLFPTKGAAEKEMERWGKKLKTQGTEAFSISTETRVRYQDAERRLSEAGISLDEAVSLALLHGKRKKGPIELQELWVKFKQSRVEKEVSAEWIKKLWISIGDFLAGREMKLAHEVTKKEVRDWIWSEEWTWKTQQNYLGTVSSMFAWGIEEGYLGVNPCLDIELRARVEPEIGTLSVEASESLLTTALNGVGEAWNFRLARYEPAFIYRPAIGVAAIGLFGGPRPEEMKRTPRSSLHIDDGVMMISAQHAKPSASRTRRRRVIELPPNARAWLKIWNELCPGDWIVPPAFKHDWRALRVQAGCWPWPHDAMRHTCASMDYAVYQDEARHESDGREVPRVDAARAGD